MAKPPSIYKRSKAARSSAMDASALIKECLHEDFKNASKAWEGHEPEQEVFIPVQDLVARYALNAVILFFPGKMPSTQDVGQWVDFLLKRQAVRGVYFGAYGFYEVLLADSEARDALLEMSRWCCVSKCDGIVSWISKKQPTVALSSTEAEYKAACFAACEAVWLRRILTDLGVQVATTTLQCDNQSCMAIAKNPVFHARTKHIEIQYHYVRELIEDEIIELEYCPTLENQADIFTKPLPSNLHYQNLHPLGIGPRLA
ncbi:hypothetical protein L7F22_042559 [Adiantum nelumboides]|nr:hypothetical protein [Adiantum nelumboides]